MLFMILSTDLVYEEQECVVVKSGKDKLQTARKKYPWILARLSLDKLRSILGYFAEYPWILFPGKFLTEKG